MPFFYLEADKYKKVGDLKIDPRIKYPVPTITERTEDG